MSKYGVFPGQYFPIFGLNTEYLDTFHTMLVYWRTVLFSQLAPLLLYITIKDSSNVSLIRSRFRNPATVPQYIYIYINIFAFEKMKHFSLVFNFSSKFFFFRKSNISWHQQKTKKIVKYRAQLQTWRLWTITYSFIVIYSSVIERKHKYMKN